MTWDNQRKQQFRHALQDVYRSYSALQIFVRDAIDRNLAEIVEQSGLTSAAFELVEWSEARGEIDRLYAAFCMENDHHPFAMSIDASTDLGLNSHNSGVFTSPTSSSSSSGPMSNSGSNSGRIINTQGGDYRETHLHDRAQYAEGDINNQTDQRREQKGVNANDGAVVNIGTVINHYGGSSSDSPPSASADRPSDPPSNIKVTENPYVSHRAIEGVCKAALIQPGSLVRIKAPHRFGKTELISQLQTFAEGEGYNVVVLDLNRVEASNLESLDRFLRWFCTCITRKLKLYKPSQIKEQIEEYWDDELGANTSCSEFIEGAILSELDEPLVLALDNVDALFKHQAIVQEFFKLLRSWYEVARREPIWQKFRLILAHSTEPYEFLKIADSNHSPFNVGEPIELPAFDQTQVRELVAQFGLTSRVDLNRLYTMLDGHPELLHIGLKFLRMDTRRSLDDLWAESQKIAGVFSSHLGGLEKLLRNKKADYLSVMRRVAKSAEPFAVAREKADRDVAVALVRFGLVREVGDRCIVPRCELYREHFRDLA
jgi:hypothetical protein